MGDRQVIVVGAGPTGLATALGLAKKGIQVSVVDRDDEIGTAPRALIHLYPTLDGFEALGIREDVEKRGLLAPGFNFVVWETMETIPVNHDPVKGIVRFPYAVSLGQDEITEVLLDHLRREPSAEVILGTALVGIEQAQHSVTGVFTTTDGELRLAADWLVGADGADSAVRKLCGSGFDGMTWPDRFVATNVRGPFETIGFADANMIMDPVYGAILLRIGNTGTWRFTYRESGDLPIETYAERIPEQLRGFTRGQIDVEVLASSPYRMHQRCADDLRHGRVLLAGDAAHITNPTGGLGLTAGFHDAFSLSETLGAVVTGVVPEELLTAWAAERRAAFVERVSPAATANKQLLFDGFDPLLRERSYRQLRFVAATPHAQLNQLLMMAGAASPSVVARYQAQEAVR